MTLEWAYRFTLWILAAVTALQGLEILILTRNPEFRAVWADANVLPDLKRVLPFPPGLTALALSLGGLSAFAVLQILTALAASAFPHPIFFGILFFTQLVTVIRFRGAFNGGSDMMTFVVLTGVLIAQIGGGESAVKWGMLYVAINLLYSYFKAGLAKARAAEWRDGSALPAFLKASLYPEMRHLGAMLERRRGVARVLSWAILSFELSAIALPFATKAVPIYFALAVCFHFANYSAFGLNRFFWIWLAAWPAVFYTMAALEAH